MSKRQGPSADPSGESEDHWNLDDWVAYKKKKAHAFIDRGYSVEWYPDAYAWMSVYLPERFESRRPQVLAAAKFYMEPSGFGIDGGKISKLSITATRTDLLAQVAGRVFEKVQVLYNYDRGLDVDRLAANREAVRLYRAVMDELN